MKKFFVLLSLLILVFACEKETDSIKSEQSKESTLTILKNDSYIKATYSIPFEILSAGIYESSLYMTVAYVGGEFGHQFSVDWDGTVVSEGNKKIVKLDIYHVTEDDNGNNQMMDSLTISLDALEIPESLLQNKDLWYDVVNTSKPENHILFDAYSYTDYEYDTEVQIENIEMVVVDSECDLGVWKELWLKNEDNNSEAYFLPLEIDETISYVPSINDKLKISYEYTYFTDSTTTINCDIWFEHNVSVIKITELEKID